MRVHSFVPFLGLSLFTLAVADDNSTSSASPSPTFVNGAIYSTDTPTPNKRAAVPATPARRAFNKRDAAICEDLPARWSYVGCYADDASNRALTGPSYCDDDGLAEEKCIEFCDAKGYTMAGLEFGSECYCGYSLGPSGTKVSELDCNMPCTGNDDELCGAGDRLNVFTNGDAAPTVLPQAGDYTSLGCYSDSASARTLTTRMSLNGNVRVTDCTSACSDAGYPYAGLEYADECYCGASLQNGGAPIAAASCNMACTADKTEYCGGPAAINIYHSSAPVQTAAELPAGWVSQSCYTDDVSHRTLAHQISLASSTTVESCISACSSAGFSMAGLEFGSECYCGNTLDNGASPASSGCDMACAGNHAETCGGAGRINIYEHSVGTCGKPGCYNGYGLIKEIYVPLSDCIAACNADSSCYDIQFSLLSDQGNVCNLFNVPLVDNYAYGYETNTYCMTYSFYDKTCAV